MTYQKGQSGNLGGRPKLQKSLTAMLRLEIAENPHKLRQIATKLIDMAVEGDLQAATIVFDRLEGRPVQKVEMDAEINVISPEERTARIAELGKKLLEQIDYTEIDGGSNDQK